MEREGINQEQFAARKTQETRTPRQERVIFDRAWKKQKHLNRLRNVQMATGWVHTSNGVTWIQEGIGGNQPKPKKEV